MSDEIPIIKPIKLKEYEVKQSKYNVASKIPMRSIRLGPSASGKSILLQNFILNIYFLLYKIEWVALKASLITKVVQIKRLNTIRPLK